MSNPWDRPPIPKRGDEDEKTTFSCVGRIMTNWEAVEFEFSRLYTWFGGSLDDQTLMNEYGKGTIFRNRIEILKIKADEFFVKSPNQNRECEFHSLTIQAEGYAGRRNDIAHGMLFQIDQLTYFRDRIKANLLKRTHYAIIPPLHAFRATSADGFPSYAYTSREMLHLVQRLWALQQSTEKFRLRG